MKKMQANRTYKSRIFEMIFSNPKELLSLYNAVNGTHYQEPELLEIIADLFSDITKEDKGK
ncbi:hypothetical protein D7Y05_03515 [bacterium 1XD42-54]|nr:hypothetical protein D7Y05_03515 [bacterium 1XD42-54]